MHEALSMFMAVDSYTDDIVRIIRDYNYLNQMNVLFDKNKQYNLVAERFKNTRSLNSKCNQQFYFTVLSIISAVKSSCHVRGLRLADFNPVVRWLSA